MITVKEQKLIQVTRVKTIWEKVQPLLYAPPTEKFLTTPLSKIVTLKLSFIPNLRKLEKFNTFYEQHVDYDHPLPMHAH